MGGTIRLNWVVIYISLRTGAKSGRETRRDTSWTRLVFTAMLAPRSLEKDDVSPETGQKRSDEKESYYKRFQNREVMQKV